MSFNVSIFHKFHNQADDFAAFPRDSARVFNARISAEGWDCKDVPEWVFHATNAPYSLLDDEQTWFKDQYRGAKLRSVSVGDVVVVNDRVFRCEGVGWIELKD